MDDLQLQSAQCEINTGFPFILSLSIETGLRSYLKTNLHVSAKNLQVI